MSCSSSFIFYVLCFLKQAKRRQNEFDQNYSGCLKDLEKLVETFGKLKSSKTKSKTGTVLYLYNIGVSRAVPAPGLELIS